MQDQSVPLQSQQALLKRGVSSRASKFTGGEAQLSWNGSAGLKPAQTPRVLLARSTLQLSNKRHCQGGPAWGSRGEIKGQYNIRST